MQPQRPPDPNNQTLRGTHQIYRRGMQSPPPIAGPPYTPPPMPPHGHGRPLGGMTEGSRVALFIVAVMALLVFLLIGLGLIATLLPAGDPNRGVVSLGMLLGSLIALVGIVKLLRQR